MVNDYRDYTASLNDSDDYMEHAWKNHKYLYIDSKGNYVYPKVQKAAKAIKSLYTKALITTKLGKLKNKIRRKLNVASGAAGLVGGAVKGYGMVKKANKANAAKRAQREKVLNSFIGEQRNAAKGALKSLGNTWGSAQKSSAQKKKENKKKLKAKLKSLGIK